MQFNALYMCHRPSTVKTMKNDPQLLNLWIESSILLIRVGMHGGLTLEGQSLGCIILELEPIWRSFFDAPLFLSFTKYGTSIGDKKVDRLKGFAQTRNRQSLMCSETDSGERGP